MKEVVTLLCHDPGYLNIGLSLLKYNTRTGVCTLEKAENIELMKTPENTLWDLLLYYQKFIEGEELDFYIYEKPYLQGKTLARNIGMLEGIGILKACVMNNNPKTVVRFYSPSTIKKEVAGSGRADKEDVTSAVRFYFASQIVAEEDLPFNHACDSVAVGLTYLHEYYDLPILP